MKHEVAYPTFKPVSDWHPSLDRDTLPLLRQNTLLVSSANPHGERASGIFVQNVNRPRVWATVLAVPYGISRYTGLDAFIHLVVPGNSIVYQRFTEEELGLLPDKEGKLFRAQLLHIKDVECFFDRSLVDWDYS